MTRIKALGLALVAVFAMSVVASASASAHTFKSTAKTFPVKVTGTGGVQKFKSGFATIECKEAVATGEAKAASETTTIQKVEYKKECNAGLGGKVAEPILAEYEISAEGTTKILKAIKIEVTGSGCTVEVFAQGPLGTLTFTNEAGGIKTTANVTGIHSKGSGGLCGSTEATAGTYEGTVTSKAAEGELKWE